MKIRIGNDFKTKWAITWLGEPEDFSDATDIALFFNIYDKKIELTKDVDYTITNNIIEIDVTPDICNILGVYNLELHYTKPNDDFIDGERRSAVDIDAFRIVGKSEKADATQDVSIISDAVAIFLDIAYKKLEEIEANEDVRIASENERKDAEDVRIASENERKDAEDVRIANEDIRLSNEQDRQINTTTAISNAEQATLNANNSAVYANEQGSYAEEMSSHPPTIINDYWHIWNFTTNQYESTGQYARGDSAIDGALVVQEKGQSAVNTMSQKAVTDELVQLAGKLHTSKADQIEFQALLARVEYIESEIGLNHNVADFGASPLATADENTLAIQSALNLKGNVLITEPGTYYVNRSLTGINSTNNSCLIIYSNTHLKLSAGVKLMMESGSNGWMIRNSDPDNGNVNISFSGGEYDFNLAGNTPSYPSWPGHGIDIRKITNLYFTNMLVHGNHKYSIQVSSCTGLYVDTIEFIGPSSDGIHLQGPMTNFTIKNITGATGDNTIGMTISDYLNFKTTVGNYLNGLIENVNVTNSTQPIRLVGKLGYEFRDITIKNIKGTVNNGHGIGLIDDPVQADELTGAEMHNILIEDVDLWTLNGYKVIDISAIGAKSIICRKIRSSNLLAGPCVETGVGTNLDSLVCDDIARSTGHADRAVKIRGTVTSFKGINWNCSASALMLETGGYIVSGTMDIVTVSDGTFLEHKNALEKSTISVSNLIFTGSTLCQSFGLCDLVLTDVNVAPTSRMVWMRNAASVMRITGSNFVHGGTYKDGVYPSGTGQLSVDLIGYVALLDRLFPLAGDRCTSKWGGIYQYDGSAWQPYIP